jgi:bifunctional DNA-binding transcriptional regulator/antitoxin component of YhaV-PrlF toxin-antitoxin module
MSTLKVTAKRQVTLRTDVLDHLGVRPGDAVTVEKIPGAVQIGAVRGTAKISDVFGSLKHRGQRRLSIKEIGKIAADGWAGKR